MASLVLPAPPAPTIVRSRLLGSRRRSAISACSCCRPMSGVGGAGSDGRVGNCTTATCSRATISLRRSFERAMRKNVGRSLADTASTSASRSAISNDGRRRPLSSIRTVCGEQPTRSASASCVKSCCVRRRLSQPPKEGACTSSGDAICDVLGYPGENATAIWRDDAPRVRAWNRP